MGFAVGCVAAALSAADDRPNILFIAVDDLKPALSNYSDDFVYGPNFQRLADQGKLSQCSLPASSLWTLARECDDRAVAGSDEGVGPKNKDPRHHSRPRNDPRAF